MSNGGMGLGNFLWGPGGQRLSASEVARRRALAESLQPQQAPQDYWSGVNSIVGNIGAALHNWQADQAEATGRGEYDAMLSEVLASGANDIASLAPLLTHDFSSQAGSALSSALLNRGWAAEDLADQRRYDAGLLADQRAYDAPFRDAQLQGMNIGNQTAQLQLDALMNPAPPAPVWQGNQWWDTSGAVPVPLTDAMPSDSAAEEAIQRIMELGYTREQAIQMSQQYVLGQDETGRSILLDRATGAPAQPLLLPGQVAPNAAVTQGNLPPPPGASAFPGGEVFEMTETVEPNYSTLPEGTDINAALGLGGMTAGAVNSIVDTIFGNAPFEAQTQAANALQNLRLQTNQALLEGFAGRQNVYTQQMIDDLAVTPGMAPTAARDRITQTRTLMDQQIARIENEVLANPSAWTPQDVRDARTSVASLRALRDTYNAILASFSNAQSAGNQNRPPLESFMR